MALSGFALGGASEGILGAQRNLIQQQSVDNNMTLGLKRLQLEQQSQAAAQQRFDQARHDQIASDAMKQLIEAVSQMRQSGQSPAAIQKALGPALDTLRQNAKLRGIDPTTAVDIPFNAKLSTPSFDIASLVQTTANKYEIPENELHNAIQTESGGNPNAVNKKSGAAGIAQFTPQTAAARGVSPFNPDSAVPGMGSYVSDLTRQFNGNRGLAWAAYNWGPGNVQKWMQNGADPKQMPKETQNYVLSVTGKPVEEWVKGGQEQPSQANPDQLQQIYSALNSPSVDPNIKKVLATKLNSIVNPGSNVEVKVLKDENQNDHVVFVDPTRRTITDQNGNPYVTPTGDNSDTQAIGDAIISGKQPPVTTGLYRNAKAVKAYLARKDFDLTQANLEWESAHKQVLSLNGPQMVRYSGLAKSVINTIDEVNNLAGEMKNSGVPLLNAAKIQAYIQTAGNSPGGQLASRYLAAVNTLKEEFANLAQGGYAPTEAAWSLANQQINGNYGTAQLNATLKEVQRLLRYRLQGIPNFEKLGPGAENRFVPGSSTPQPQKTPAVQDYTDYFK